MSITSPTTVARQRREASEGVSSYTLQPGHWLLLGMFLLFLSGDFVVLGVQVRMLALPVATCATAAWIATEAPRARPLKLAFPLAMGSLLIGWMAFSGMWAPSDSSTRTTVIDLGFMAFALYLTVAICRRAEPKVFATLWRHLFVVSLAYWVVGYMSSSGAAGRWAVPGGGPNVFVRAMALGIVASIYLSQSRRSILPLAGTLIFFYGALLSGSRGGVLSLALVILLAFPSMARRWGRMRFLAVTLLTAIAAPTGWRLLPSDLRARLERRFIDSTIFERYTSGRADVAESALEVFDENLLIGAGIDAVRAQEGLHAHNLPLSIAAEGGVVGLILFALTVGGFARAAYRRRHSKESFYFGVTATIILCMSMFSGYYYDSRFIWFFAILACAAKGDCVVTRHGTPPTTQPQRSRARSSYRR